MKNEIKWRVADRILEDDVGRYWKVVDGNWSTVADVPLAAGRWVAPLIAASPRIYRALDRLTGIAQNISNAQHAGIEPGDEAWSELYAAVNFANAVLLETEGLDE